MDESPLSSPTLQALPPLPQCLKKQVLSEHFKEVERNRTLKSLVQPDYEKPRPQEGEYINMEKYKIKQKSVSPELETGQTESHSLWRGNIGAAIGHLKNEIKTLRRQDVSLLCQLCALNESIQEYKSLMQDRMDSISESSSVYSVDFTIDENEGDSYSLMSRTDSECNYNSVFRLEAESSANSNGHRLRNFANKMESRMFSYRSDFSRSKFSRMDLECRSPVAKSDSFSVASSNRTLSDTLSNSSSWSSTPSSKILPGPEPMYLEPKSEPYYANITTSRESEFSFISIPRTPATENYYHKNVSRVKKEPLYENFQDLETSVTSNVRSIMKKYQ